MDHSVLKKVKKFLRGKQEKEVGFTEFWEGTKSFYPTDLSKTKVKEWLKEHSDCFQIIKAPNGNPFGKVKLIEKDKGLEVELPHLNANEDFQIKEKLISSIDNEEENGHLFAIICRDKASIFPAKLQDKKLIRKWLIAHDDWFKLVYGENGGLFSVEVLNKARKNKRGGRGLSKTTSPNDAQTKQNVSCITKKLNASGGTMLLEHLFKDLATGNIVKEKSELMTVLTDFPSTFEIYDLGETAKFVHLKESFAEPNQSKKISQSCDYLNKNHVSQIIQFIFQNDGTVSYNKTLECIKSFISGLPSSDDDILQLLKLANKFEIIEKPESPGKPWMIKVKFYSQPRLCQTYLVHGQCSRKKCPFLHICKLFICQQPHNSEQCQLSHDFHDEHNKIIMEKMGEISKESNKTIANVLYKSYFPRVCMEYNKNGNCPRKDKCHFLHVCGDYVLNQCSKSPCSLNHNINGDMHNINLLKKYALLPSKQLPIEIVKANIAYAQVGNINTKLNIPPSPMNVLHQGLAFNIPESHLIPQMPQFFPPYHQRPLAPIFQHQTHFQNNLPHQISIPPLVQQMNPSFIQRPPPLMEVPTYLGNGARKERAKKNTPEIKSSTLGEEKKHKRNRGARRRKKKGTTTTSSSVDDSGMVDNDISDEESEEFLHDDKESSMLSWENLENSHLSNKMSGFQKVENWMGNSVESTMNKVCNEKDESDSSSSSEISTFSSIPSSAALSQQSQWKDELQKKVFLTILEKFNGNGSFKKILKEKDLFPENNRNIEEWFSKYPRMFILHRNGRGNVDTVTVFSTKARICLDYNGRKGGCYKTNCEYVHICRNYFEGRCNGCNLNHDIASSEVDLVKKRMGFEDLTSEQFSTLVAMSVPSVCRYHNQGNCNRGKFCPNLHVCKKFIQRRAYCREKSCKFGHESSLTDDHAKRILKMYHMFKDQPNIKYLQKMIFVFERERKISNVFKNREDNNVLEDNNADQDNELKREEKTAKVSKKTSNQMKVEDEVISNNESRTSTDGADVSLQPLSSQSSTSQAVKTPYKTTIEPDTQVYRKVVKLLSHSSSFQINHIEKIVNENLWQQYTRKKKAMSDVLQPGENLNEREVFVPFLYEDLYNIMNDNISASRMMTTTPQPLGRGYYFTSDVTKSLQWCLDNLGDTRSKINLLVCQVLLGESTKGNRYLREFPRREDGRFFDSLVDNKENPSLFVISNIEQCYPVYVIDFTFPQSSSAHLGSPVQNASDIVGNSAPDVHQTSLPYQQPPPAYEEVPSSSTYSIAQQVQTSALENREWAKVVPSNPSRNSTHPERPPQYTLHPQSSSGQQNCNDESVASTFPLVTRRDKKEKDCIVM